MSEGDLAVVEPESVPRRATVYRLYDAQRSLLYVGCTVEPWARLRSHEREQPWWDEVTATEIAWYATEDLAATAEQQAILTEHPVHNVSLMRYALRKLPDGAADDSPFLDRAAVAVRLGVEPETVTQYLYRTRQRLAANRPLRIWDMPLPDGQIGREPWWYEATIVGWEASRPGQGVGGGRPRKTTDEEQAR